MRFADLSAGDTFPASSFTLDVASVERYLAATDDDNALFWRDGAPHLAPPLAVAALAFRDIAAEVALQPGSLHTGQELSFHRLVRVGERLTTQARVATSSHRRGFTALVVELAAIGDDARPALSGRMTLMIAADDQAGAPMPPRPAKRSPILVPPITLTSYATLSAADVAAGRSLGALTHTLSQDRIDRYADASGDYNPIHVDPAFAASTPFGAPVAHGMLLLAYVSALVTRAFGEAFLAGGTLKVKFRNPAPVGSTVTARGEVERRDEDAHGVQYALCAVRLENSDGEAPLTGEARVPIR